MHAGHGLGNRQPLVDQQGLVDAHADEENHKLAIQGGGQAFFVDHGGVLGF